MNNSNDPKLPLFIAQCDAVARQGKKITFWWRDDDAIAETLQLHKLSKITHGNPISLATIPTQTNDSLISYVKRNPNIRLLQHGVRHRNQALPDNLKTEFPHHISDDTLLADIAYGRQCLYHAYPDWDGDVFAPPWNRMSLSVAERLQSLGFAYLTGFIGRSGVKIPTQLMPRFDCMIDPVAWREKTDFIGWKALDTLLSQHCKNLYIGILTHHLIHSDHCFDALAYLADIAHYHPAISWCDPFSR